VKHLLLFCIGCYWKFYPKAWKGTCLFQESCSHHVYRKTDAEGFLAGIEALKSRLKKCKHGYLVMEMEGETVILLSDKTIIDEKEYSPKVLLRTEGSPHL